MGALNCGVKVRCSRYLFRSNSRENLIVLLSEIRASRYFYCSPYVATDWMKCSKVFGSRSFKVFLPSILLYIFCGNPKQYRSSGSERKKKLQTRRYMYRYARYGWFTFQCRDFHQDECAAPNAHCTYAVAAEANTLYVMILWWCSLDWTKPNIWMWHNQKSLCVISFVELLNYSRMLEWNYICVCLCVCVGSELLGHIKVPITVNSAEFSIYCETQSLNFAMNAISDQRNVRGVA